MRQGLEVRLAAAVNDIKSAELEKNGKIEVAQKSLAEQELIMEKVVQESKVLKQQAEDNAKVVTSTWRIRYNSVSYEESVLHLWLKEIQDSLTVIVKFIFNFYVGEN